MPDELLRPTIGAPVDMSVRPWRLMSQTYVAFFGGVIAATIIAFLNARRLGVDATKRRLILLTGVVGLMIAIVLSIVVDVGAEGDPYALLPNVAVTATALVTSYIQQRIQRPMDRAIQLRGVDYRPLWIPGAPVSICCLALQAGIASLLAGAL